MVESTNRTTKRQRARFVAVALGVVVVGVAGYVGFARFVGTDRTLGAGVMALAAGTGFAAFFSPCSFPLLLTFLSRRSTDRPGAALLSAFRVGAGAAGLLAVLAGLVTIGGTAVGGVVGFETTTGRVFRVGVGLLLLILGLRQSGRVRIGLRWLDIVATKSSVRFDPAGASSQARKDVVYGFGYLIAGFG